MSEAQDPLKNMKNAGARLATPLHIFGITFGPTIDYLRYIADKTPNNAFKFVGPVANDQGQIKMAATLLKSIEVAGSDHPEWRVLMEFEINGRADGTRVTDASATLTFGDDTVITRDAMNGLKGFLEAAKLWPYNETSTIKPAAGSLPFTGFFLDNVHEEPIRLHVLTLAMFGSLGARGVSPEIRHTLEEMSKPSQRPNG